MAWNEEVRQQSILRKNRLKRHRTRTYDMQKGRCHYCKRKFGRPEWTIDHVIPISKGGTDRPENLVGACQACNWKKSSMLPKEFLKSRPGWRRTLAELAKKAQPMSWQMEMRLTPRPGPRLLAKGARMCWQKKITFKEFRQLVLGAKWRPKWIMRLIHSIDFLWADSTA